jgi:multidrug transporter EmrE-like cation transporter
MPAPELSLAVTFAVLGAGLLHAGWNALLKAAPGGDPLLDTAAVVAGSSLCALVILPFVAVPDRSAWIFAGASVVLHFGYYVTLAQAYRTGDLSFAYPLMRGTAPLIVTLLGAIFLREWPTLQVTFGIALISAGIVSIAFVHRHRHPPAAARWAFANAAIIGTYTLIDCGPRHRERAGVRRLALVPRSHPISHLDRPAAWVGRVRLRSSRLAARTRRRRGKPRRLRYRPVGHDPRTGRCRIRIA